MDVVREAQQVTDVASAQAKAEVILAFYLRLRLGKKMPEPIAHDVLINEFYGYWSDEVEDDD